MKKKILIIIACVLAVALAAGIGYNIGKISGNDITAAIPKKDPAITPEISTTSPGARPAESVTYVTRSDISATSEGMWTTVGTYEGDMTGDGVSDTFTIYTSAESVDGEILWDDGQSWIAEVYDSQGGYYTLLSQYVNNGNVYAEVSENNNRKMTITLIVTNGAGLSVKRYDYTSSGFVEEVTLSDETTNVVYSSIPWYR